jgi:hypothetical protein
MPETCDRCGPSVLARIAFYTPRGPLYLCGHCANIHGRALVMLGPWVQVRVPEEAMTRMWATGTTRNTRA